MFDEPRRFLHELAAFDRPLLVAGGWAIDLFLGRETRPHSDVEFAAYREDQSRLRECLATWHWTWLEPRENGGRERGWDAGHDLKRPVHQLHARKPDDPQVELAFLLNESRGDRWVFRRDPTISRQRSQVELRTADGIGFVSPEVQLLFKSKDPRCKDEQDFQQVVSELEDERREWLRAALEQTDAGHPWLRRLA